MERVLNNFSKESGLNRAVLVSALLNSRRFRGSIKERILTYLQLVINKDSIKGLAIELQSQDKLVEFFKINKEDIEQLLEEELLLTWAEAGSDIFDVLYELDTGDPFFRRAPNQCHLADCAYVLTCSKLVRVINTI